MTTRPILAILLALCPANCLFAQSPELEQYTAIRDSLELHVPAWPSDAKIDWDGLRLLDSSARHRLAPLAHAIVGRLDAPGLVQPGVFNVETFLPGDVDSFLADGIRYTSRDSQTTVFASTPALIRLWQTGDPVRTLSSLDALNHVFPADAAVTPYAVIPIARPGRILLAILMTRQQDYGPSDPDEILLSLVRGGQLIVVEAQAPVTITVLANDTVSLI